MPFSDSDTYVQVCPGCGEDVESSHVEEDVVYFACDRDDCAEDFDASVGELEGDN